MVSHVSRTEFLHYLLTIFIVDAKPPVGDLRFRRSEPCDPWEGILDGTKEARKSFQPNVFLPESAFREGGEDCLRLNVYTKAYHNSGDGIVPDQDIALLPVLVFLHGGAFVVTCNLCSMSQYV